ncbi:MAG: sn-glycerol-1-phosphate dehydrogenase [archaeon]
MITIPKLKKKTLSNWPEYKHIKLPYNIFVGKNVLEKVSYITKEHENKLVVTGPKTSKIAGSKVARILKCDKTIARLPPLDEAERIAREVKKEEIDLLVGAGGGSVLDITKLAAFKANVDYISVPTNCANDGIASHVVSIKNGGKASLKASPPIGVVADTNIIRKSPYEFTSAGFGDAIAKFSAVKDWNLGHVVKGEYFGDYASSLASMIAKITLKSALEVSKRTEKGVNTLLEALISSGAAMGIAGSSRPASGSEHKFSHALDMIAERPALHGHQCGVGTIIMSYLHGDDWMSIKNALEIAKCPVNAKQLKTPPETLLEAVLKAKEIRPERYTILEHLKVDKQTALNALEATSVI